MVRFCIEFMRRDTLLLTGDVDTLEYRIPNIRTPQGIESWMRSAKALMTSRRYSIMKKEFLEEFRPDVGFLPEGVTDEDLEIVENVALIKKT